MRGPMRFKLNTAAAAILAVSLVALSANASDPDAAPKKHPVTKKAKEKTPPGPTVEEQIQSLRQEMQGQINGLKDSLAQKDAELQSAKQAAADAQAAAAKAEAAASASNQAIVDNTTAVTTLQGTVTDLKANQLSLAFCITRE